MRRQAKEPQQQQLLCQWIRSETENSEESAASTSGLHQHRHSLAATCMHAGMQSTQSVSVLRQQLSHALTGKAALDGSSRSLVPDSGTVPLSACLPACLPLSPSRAAVHQISPLPSSRRAHTATRCTAWLISDHSRWLAMPADADADATDAVAHTQRSSLPLLVCHTW